MGLDETACAGAGRELAHPHDGPVADDRVLACPARLRAVADTGLLDTGDEDPFDRWAVRATELTGAGTALISLVDATRSYFKSFRLSDGSAGAGRELPISMSLCREVVTRDEPLIVGDTLSDPRTKDYAVHAFGVGAYAGIPLRSTDGHCLGSLCVVDAVPREWTGEQVAALADLAAAVQSELRLRGALREARRYEALVQIHQRIDALMTEGAARATVLAELVAGIEQQTGGLRGAIVLAHAGPSAALPGEICCATPITGTDGVSHGTFALCGDPPRDPLAQDLALLHQAARLAAVVLERDAASRALREAEALFRGAFTDASVAMCLATLDERRWAQVNPALCALLGYRADQLVGRSFDEVTHPDDVADGFEGTRRLLDGEISVYEAEKRYLHAAGHVVWAALSVSLLRDAHGAPRCFIAQILDITARKRTVEALLTSERRLADAQALGEVGSWEWDLESDCVTWSQQLCEIAGFPAGGHPTTLDGTLGLVHEEDRERVAQTFVRAREPGVVASEYRLVRADGGIRWVHGRRREIHDADGRVVRMSGTLQDITRRRAAEDALRDAEERFRRSFDEAPIGMALVSLEGRLSKVNDALCEIVGYSPAELTALRFQDITHPDDLAADEALVREVIAGERATYRLDKRYLHADGRIVWAQLNVSLARDAAGRPMYFISQIQDITERRSFEERLQHMARRDHLTGLFNRRGFEEELERQLAGARRFRRGGALLMLDLDGFKAVNDSFGHEAGDELLRSIAGGLKERLRETDILGRLGGDEFAIVLPQVSAEEAQTVVAAVGEVIVRRSLLVDRRVRLTASIGCVPFDGDEGAHEILAAADAEMYAAKRAA